jgi:phosphoribosylamine--glycine ligase
LVTDGGRVLGVVGSGETIGGSRVAAYAGIEKIFFRGARFRRDIAERAV